MEQKLIFRERLGDLLDLASAQGNRLSQEDVRSFFRDLPLDEEHYTSIFLYLQEKGIQVGQEQPPQREGAFQQEQLLQHGLPLQQERPFQEEQPLRQEQPDEGVGLGEVDLVSYYIDDLEQICKNAVDALQNGTPLMEAKKELELFAAAGRGDLQARKELAGAYLPVVCQIVEEYDQDLLSQEDLIQEGNLGLLTTLASLEDVSTLAACQAQVWSGIHQALRAAVEEARGRKDSDQNIVNRTNQIREAAQSLKKELGHEISAEELSAFLDLPLEEILSLLRITGE